MRVPSPDYSADPESLQGPHTPTEILGRGEESRPAKTFLQDASVAHVLSHIGGWSETLADLLRRKHASENHVAEEVETEDGRTVVRHRPEVLSDQELREEYPVIRWWESLHQEQVRHRASTEGFSVKQATQSREEEPRESASGSSVSDEGSGSSRRNGRPTESPRWR